MADLSQLNTLEPGDVILTGTPAGSSVVVPGDTLEVEVDAPTAKGKPATGRLVSTITQGTHELPAFSAGPKVDDLQREEAWGSREAAGMPASILTPELKKKINSVSTATLSSVLRKKGFNNVSIDGLQSTRPGKRMLGLARTLRYIANREDLFEKFGGGFNAQKRAIESVGPDEVLVMEARGEKGTGTVGDILAIRAQLRGCEGIVTDGGVRDVAAVSALDMPTYFANPHPAVLGRRHVPWDTDITITCGGCAVQPGDVIVGDADGVLVIPPHLIDDVVDAAIVQEAEEEFILAMVKKGEKVDTLYPMDAEWKKRFEVWRKGKK